MLIEDTFIIQYFCLGIHKRFAWSSWRMVDEAWSDKVAWTCFGEIPFDSQLCASVMQSHYIYFLWNWIQMMGGRCSLERESCLLPSRCLIHSKTELSLVHVVSLHIVLFSITYLFLLLTISPLTSSLKL